MLKMTNPKDWYVGAILDQQGNAVKVTCDILAVAHFVLDSNTTPMVSLVVTYVRENTDGFQAGPATQHMIVGDELILILETSPDGSISVAAIEASTLRTGIPSAHIAAEDLEPAPVATPYFRDRLIAMTKKALEEEKRRRDQPIPPLTGPTGPGPSVMPPDIT